MSSDNAQILQLVDMHIYALSRFIQPTPAGRVLADFEAWPFGHASKTLERFLDGTDVDGPTELIERYFHISTLYHNLRARLIKNVFMGKSSAVSSFVLIGAQKHTNFADALDQAIWLFCNTMDWRDARPVDLSAFP